jgi:GPH family glycoside/pentoside/hexuronide:cation symporter
LYYYTDIFGLSPAAVGTMFLITKLIDVITDPVMGIVADRTHTRWGKFRPYLLWMALPYGICGYAMFANPELSESGKLIYAYITYTLMMLAYTAINVPYSALMGVISPVSIERTKVSSYRFFFAFSAGWLIVTFVRPLKDLLGGGDEVLGFQLVMAIFAVLSVAFFWICFATTKERVAPPPKQNTNVKADLAALMRNGPWLVLFVAGILTLMSIAVRAGGTMYYFKYFIGDDGAVLFHLFGLDFDRTSIFMSLGTLAMLFGLVFTKALVTRFEKRTLMIALSLGNVAASIGFFFIPPDQYWTMVFVNCLGSIINGPTPAIVWAMYADSADYGEWKTGRRTTGLVFSGIQFAHKMGLAVGAGLSGYILAWYGFVANEVQTESSIMGIRLMFTVFPGVLAILGTLAFLFYRLDQKTISQIESELGHATPSEASSTA